ncbi:DUF5988 family protein [Streptomyces sp. NRRL S-350]|uniref:DUF5988 family protein n=1 Tax=Streptomyces sp. NRRL S-350 TaxID=1463902 RepID=UPI00131DA238|nr:DUF5988 family protein [Streptomyces sp. NRRL S-350]
MPDPPPVPDPAPRPNPAGLVVLRGGPPGLSPLHRIPEAQPAPSRVVITFYGRHQHFERTRRTESVRDVQLPVFQWTYSTAVAE